MRHNTLTYARTMSAVEESGAAYRTAIQGRVFQVEDDLRLTMLHPRSRRLRGTRSDLNSNSVVVRIDHGEDCILLTGDSEDPTERSILQNGLDPCEVLKVAHHGSGHSTSAGWLRVLQPKIALISVGKDNRYGHPDPDTLARLKAADVDVHRTDLEGTLTLVSTGKGVRMETARAPEVAATPAETAPVYAGPSRLTATGQVNINKADVLTLDRLPGIGPSRAASIIADRETNGPFSSCDELERVRGIGPKTVALLGPQCTTNEGPKTQ
jgi:competence protein ComEC